MRNRLPTGLIVIAALQWVSILCLPPALLMSISPVLWIVLAVLFVGLGIMLLQRRAWARLATIFVQGFNIIVRLLVLLPNVASKAASGQVQVDYAMLGTFLLSMLLSAAVLYYVDLPDVQMLMA
ncbi:MAG: hypothetical protein GX557_15200 [Chloroflexi bacterium]|nr:hypothetical protein [Chloroflexota bacterium]